MLRGGRPKRSGFVPKYSLFPSEITALSSVVESSSAPAFRGTGDLDYACAHCGETLVVGAAEGSIYELTFVCPNCGGMSAGPQWEPGTPIGAESSRCRTAASLCPRRQTCGTTSRFSRSLPRFDAGRSSRQDCCSCPLEPMKSVPTSQLSFWLGSRASSGTGTRGFMRATSARWRRGPIHLNCTL